MLRSKDLATLRRLTSEKIRAYGFSKFSYIGLNPPESPKRSFVESTYPEGWIEEYRVNQFVFLDPTMARAKASLLPIAWDAEDFVRRVTPAQKKFFHLGGDYGIKRGIVVPVHAPGGEFAAMAFASDEGSREMRSVWTKRRHELHLIGIYFHAAVWENVMRRRIQATPALSPRELQCVEWSARGKTLWETSEILGISEATAKTHLKAAMKKLGTYNRTHAVSKALVYGLIKICLGFVLVVPPSL
ncbi:MAG TPA: LuxR family transcriptional regulator [Sphingomonadales bacterium]|nr:LuxR family transcriptional regulator [Sphingomonadales bacterium]